MEAAVHWKCLYGTCNIARLFLSFNVHKMKVLMSLNVKVTAFWIMTPYSLVDMYQSFGRTCRFSLQGRVWWRQ